MNEGSPYCLSCLFYSLRKASTGLRFAATPEQMAIFASIAGAIAVTGGLFGSLEFDTPSGPSIVVAALVLFLLSLLPYVGRKQTGQSPS